jgi:DNA repair exonuclease SbcCD nuclease subunit
VPSSALRVLLVADSHLGFDLPQRPRVERRRRGPDFFANFEHALRPALAGQVDLVVHGGDLLYRSKVRRQLVLDAFAPLKRVAGAGVQVFLVPGNHERSAIPFPLLGAHPGIHVFERPQTFWLQIQGLRVAVAGFPCVRNGIAARFEKTISATEATSEPADIRLLCLHQTVEGARVGPAGFTFRGGDDVIAGAQIPRGFAAVLAGHIHRRQVLERDLGGRPMAAPVLYPGSVERTSYAERNEPKGFLTLELQPSREGGRLLRWRFHELPTRPMVRIELDPRRLDGLTPEEWLSHRLRRLPPDAVVGLRVFDSQLTRMPEFARLRAVAPPTMTLELSRSASPAHATP